MSALKLFWLPLGIALISLYLVQATVFLPGQCPTDRPIVKNFTAKRYAGLWYEYMRKTDSYNFLGDCNTIIYTPHENNTIGIKEFRTLPDPVIDETEVTYAVYADPDQTPLEGRWNISYQWNKPYFENHRIMDTDYESYSITYLCLSAGSEYITDEFVIYTRDPTVKPELEKKFIDTINKHYNLDLMMKPRQTDCRSRDDNIIPENKFIFDKVEVLET